MLRTLKAPKALLTLITFGLVGPFVGGCAAMPWIVFLVLFAMPRAFGSTLRFFYTMGLFPAILKGMCFAVSSEVAKRRVLPLVMTTIIGGIAAFGMFEAFIILSPQPAHPVPRLSTAVDIHLDVWVAFGGAAAAFVCGLLSQRLWGVMSKRRASIFGFRKVRWGSQRS